MDPHRSFFLIHPLISFVSETLHHFFLHLIILKINSFSAIARILDFEFGNL